MSKLKSARAAKAQSHSVPKPVAMALARAKAGNATLEDIMLALKSFRTAAVTFSGIELAHRIHKRQFAVTYERDGRALSLKQLWDQTLSSTTPPGLMEKTPPPLTHQNSISRSHPLVNRRHPRRTFVRYARRVSFGAASIFSFRPPEADTGATTTGSTVERT